MSTTTTYLVGIHGVNYRAADQSKMADWAVCYTLTDVREYLARLSINAPIAAGYHANMADGSRILETPGYGEPGDGALIYVTTGTDARAARALGGPDYLEGVDWEGGPAYVATFGPRGGLKLERA